MKKLMTMTFEMVPDEHQAFQASFERLKTLLVGRDVESSLYRDLSHGNRFMLTFLTSASLDEITLLIQQDPEAQQCFAQMKGTESRIVVSALQQVI